jgi:hypothetical protein
MTEVATIQGKHYRLMRATVVYDDDDTSCYGCAFDAMNEEDGIGCGELLRGIVPSCKGNMVYIEDTPEAIAEYMAERLT